MKLYQNLFSAAAMKARAVVAELGLACELVDVDMSPAKREQKSPAFLAMNPNGMVPTLEDDGFCVWESNAILCYLAAKKPEAGLMPSDPRGLATLHQWLQWQATTLGPAISDVLMETVYPKLFGSTPNPEKLAAGMEKVRAALDILDKSLAGKEYVCGKLTIADFSLHSSVLPRTHMGFDLEAYPNVKAWALRMESRESVRKSLPPL